MKTLAIDYGTNKIGLAMSNQTGTISFPYKVIDNNSKLISTLRHIIKDENIEQVVIGVPKYNPKTKVYDQIQELVTNLTAKLAVPIETQDELLTSSAADRIDSDQSKNRHDLAAMLILQEYLKTIPRSQKSASSSSP